MPRAEAKTYVQTPGPSPMVVAAKRLLGPLRWSRPKRIDLADAIKRSGVGWMQVADAGPWFASPRQWGWDDYDIMSILPAQHPRQGVLEIAEGIIDDVAGGVHLADGTVVPATTWYNENPAMISNFKIRRWNFGFTALPGTTLNLISEFAYNYGHFMHDVLGKLALANMAKIDFTKVDHVILPVSPSAHGTILFERAAERTGLPKDRIIWWKPTDGIRYRCERLLAPVAPGMQGMMVPAVVRELRRLTAPASTIAMDTANSRPANGRRLFVDRMGHSRGLSNIDVIRERVKRAGYELYFPENNPKSQGEDFATATGVIALHGSAINNTVYCMPGTPVMEIMATDHPHLAPVSMGTAVGCRHGIVFSDSGTKTPRKWGTINFTNSMHLSTVDPALFDKAAGELGLPGFGAAT